MKMHRSQSLLVATLIAACGSPATEPKPTPTPTAAAHADHTDHHAQEHAIEQELAQPDANHRPHHMHKHHRFEKAEEWVAQFDNPERDAWQKPDAVVAALGLARDAAVADVGAGTGYFAVRLARAVPEGKVYAQDLEPDMVRYLGERATREGLSNIVAVQGTADDPKLTEPVDVALMVDCYHHIADPTAFFAKVRDALKPAGRLVIVDFKKDAPDDAPGPPAAMRVADDIVVAHLAKLGFTHVGTDRELLPYQYIVTMARPSTTSPAK